MKRKLLITAGLVALLGAGHAFAQERTVENYPIKGGNFYDNNPEYFLQRVDANAQGTALAPDNAISYITKDVAVPFYIAPSRITHPDWDPQTGVLSPKTYGSPAQKLAFASTWILKFKDVSTSPTAVTFSQSLPYTDDHANKVTATGNELGEYVVQAEEKPEGEAFSCIDTENLPEFKLRVVSEPKIGIDLAKQTEKDAMLSQLQVKEIPQYDVTGAQVPAFLNGKKILLVNTCNPLLLNGLAANVHLENSTIEAWEENNTTTKAIPTDLRMFAFSIRSIEIKVNSDGSVKSVNHAEATDADVVYGETDHVGSLNKKLAIEEKAAVSITLPTFSLGASERSVDMVYFLSSPVGSGVSAIASGAQGGVISAVSHRSGVDPEKAEDAQNLKTYPFADYSVLVVRLSERPITGPIYHIPTSLFSK